MKLSSFFLILSSLVILELSLIAKCSIEDDLGIIAVPLNQIGSSCSPDDENSCGASEMYDCSPYDHIDETGYNVKNGTCRCTSKYITDWLSYQCLLKATQVEDSCVEDAQCESNLGRFSECSLGTKTCTCVRDSIPSQNKTKCLSKLGGECKHSKECIGFPETSQCSRQTGECLCNPGNVPNSRNDSCLPIRNIFGDKCDEPQQCQLGSKKDSSDCVDSRCICANGFVTETSQPHICFKKAVNVQDPCSFDIQCTSNLGEDSKCFSGSMCTCENGTVPTDNFTKCSHAPAPIGWPCKDACVGAPETSECTITGICACVGGHVASSHLDDCLPVVNKLGDACREDHQCQQGAPGRWSECKLNSSGSKVCTCKENSVNEPSHHKCHKKATRVGQPCESQIECIAGLGSSQCLDKTCICILNGLGSGNPEGYSRSYRMPMSKPLFLCNSDFNDIF